MAFDPYDIDPYETGLLDDDDELTEEELEEKDEVQPDEARETALEDAEERI